MTLTQHTWVATWCSWPPTVTGLKKKKKKTCICFFKGQTKARRFTCLGSALHKMDATESWGEKGVGWGLLVRARLGEFVVYVCVVCVCISWCEWFVMPAAGKMSYFRACPYDLLQLTVPRGDVPYTTSPLTWGGWLLLRCLLQFFWIVGHPRGGAGALVLYTSAPTATTRRRGKHTYVRGHVFGHMYMLVGTIARVCHGMCDIK